MRDELSFTSPFTSDDDAARDCALYIAELLAQAHRSRGRSILAICGGRSAALVLRELHLNHPVTVVATDERWLHMDSSERNDRMLCEYFGASSVARMPYSGDVGNDAESWASKLWQVGTPDVVLLSLADDGHVASLFPRHTTLRSHAPIVIEMNSPKPPHVRLSMSPSFIRRAPHRLMLAFGQEKSPMIDQIQQGHDTPATRTRPTRWYLDSAASSANGGGR